MSLVETSVAGGIATVTMNRPESRNPTSIAMLDALDEALDVVSAGNDTRVMILTGAGRSFCSGLDLDEVVADEVTIRRLLCRLSEVMRRIRRLPIATIARVQGAAIGGGFGFLAVADFALTHPDAKIGYPPLTTGLSPALMAPWLVRKIGPSRARAMLMAGGTISGRDAHEAGIVSHLVERETLEATADELAARLLTAGVYASTAMKEFLNELDGSVDDDLLDRAATVSADVIASSETQERLAKLFGQGPGGTSPGDT